MQLEFLSSQVSARLLERVTLRRKDAHLQTTRICLRRALGIHALEGFLQSYYSAMFGQKLHPRLVPDFRLEIIILVLKLNPTTAYKSTFLLAADL